MTEITRRRRSEKLLESESADARKVISERLKQYYQTEIDEFFDKEYEDLGPSAQEAWKAYRDKIRPIFEKYAKERGPLVVSLTVLTEFPNPETLVKIDPDADLAIQTRSERIRDLQRQNLPARSKLRNRNRETRQPNSNEHPRSRRGDERPCGSQTARNQ